MEKLSDLLDFEGYYGRSSQAAALEDRIERLQAALRLVFYARLAAGIKVCELVEDHIEESVRSVLEEPKK